MLTGAGPSAPGAAPRFFRFLAWALTLHIVTMAALFGLAGLPIQTVRALASWKELLAVAALVTVSFQAATGRGIAPAPAAPDIPAALLVAMAALHAIASVGGWGPPTSATLLAYGLRDTVLCFALYAVGRATPSVARDPRVFRTLLAVGALTSIVAVIERLVMTPERLVILGVASYFNDFLGMGATTGSNIFGLPDNYWTYLGGRLVQRAGSIYLSSQGFAIPFLVVIPAATTWLLVHRQQGAGAWRRPAIAFAAYTLCWTGLFLTVTRMTIIACMLQVLLIVLLLRRPAHVMAFVAVGAVSLAVLVITIPGVGWYLWDTLSWQTSSSASHARDYATGITAMLAHPLGNGLATADATALRMGLVPLTADNLFLKYGVELGIPSMIALTGWFGILVWTGVSAALSSSGTARSALGAFLAASATGIALNGGTAVVTNSLPVAYLFFWLAGSAVSALAVNHAATGEVHRPPHGAAGG